MKVSTIVPSHITGFFTIVDNNDYLKKGSCGAGLLLDKGVTTEIKSSKKEEKLDIKINGKKDIKNEIIARKAVEIIKKDFNLNRGIKINQSVDVPIGCGFGTSASCALGVILSFWKLFELPISFIQASQYAHKIEIELGSGLGDVIAEMSKGLIFRKKPGAPGVGKVDSIDDINIPDLYVITKTLGEIDTGKIIQDSYYKMKINEIGLNIQKKFANKPSIESFIKYSYEFAKKTNLMNDNVSNLVKELEKSTLGASMAMLGNTAFALSKESFSDIDGTEVYKIDRNGIKFL